MSNKKLITNRTTKEQLKQIIIKLQQEIQEYKFKEFNKLFEEHEKEIKLHIFIQPTINYFNLKTYAKNTNQTIENIINQMINYFNESINNFNNEFIINKSLNSIIQLKPFKELQEQESNLKEQQTLNILKLKN